MKNLLNWTVMLLMTMVSVNVFAQDPPAAEEDTSKVRGAGVAVSPSTINWHVAPGKQETKYITVTNDTYKDYKFKVIVNDFAMDEEGVNGVDPVTNDSINKFSISRLLNIAPTFFEVKSGQKKKIAVTVSVPDNEEANYAAWGLLMIQQAVERKTLDVSDKQDETIAMGVVPRFSFGVFLYQNPPNVEVNKVEIKAFDFITDADGLQKQLVFRAENLGDGIATCKSYMEITNLSTGEQQITPGRRFTILPRKIRVWKQELSTTMAPGKYSAITILDYGDDEIIEAAEIEFDIK